MMYELLLPSWFGRTITTPAGAKSAFKNPLICASEEDFIVSDVSKAKFPTRKSGTR
jgi:hypothetical protein